MKSTGSKICTKFYSSIYRIFYPAIKEALLHEAIQFPKEHASFTRKDIEVLFHARKSVLNNDGLHLGEERG